MEKTVIFKRLLFLFGFTLLFPMSCGIDWDSFPFGPINNPFPPGFPFHNTGFNPVRYQNDIQNTVQSDLNNFHTNFNFQMGQFNKQLNEQMKQVNWKTSVIGTVNKMVHGQGGTAIITYNGKQLIVKDNVFGLCHGNVDVADSNNVQCTGPITYDTDDDICRPIKQSLVKTSDYICIKNSYGGNLIVNTINGKMTCENGQLFTKEKFIELCGPNSFSNQYAHVKYIPNPSSLTHTPFPNENPYLPCQQRNVPYCEFDTDISGLGASANEHSSIVSQGY